MGRILLALAILAPYAALGWIWIAYGDVILEAREAERAGREAAGAAPAGLQADEVEAMRAEFAPVPDFVVPVDGVAPEDARFEPVGGRYFLLYDRQHDRRGAEPVTYLRYVVQPVSEAGVDAASNWSLTFDPSFQRIVFHELSVERDGVVEDRRDAASFDFARRERNFERRMFDGRVSALIRIDDVRPGDVLRFAYSYVGLNPAFEGQDTRVFTVGHTTPAERAHVRAIWPADERPVWDVAWAEMPGGVSERVEEDAFVLQVGPLPVEGLDGEAGAPAWWRQSAQLRITDFRDWGHVGEWGRDYFDIAPDEAARALAAEIMAEHASDADRAAAALRFAQREVRYFAVLLGQGGYVPTPPAETLRTRFGDCKAKTALLIALLRAMDIEAHAALVHLGEGEGLPYELPSPTAFNHVIVRATVDGRSYWLDPTHTHQGGGIGTLVEADYGWALPLDGSEGLVDMQAEPLAEPNLVTRETYDLTAGPDAPARLTVERISTGAAADSDRGFFAREGRVGAERGWVDFYNRALGGVETLEPLSFEDDEDANRTVLRLALTLADPFTVDEDTGQREIDFYAHAMRGFVAGDAERVRESPLAIADPVFRRQEVVVRVDPQDGWRFPVGARSLESEAFAFDYEARWRSPEEYVMRFEQRSLAEQAPAEAAGEVFAAHDAMLDLRAWELPAP